MQNQIFFETPFGTGIDIICSFWSWVLFANLILCDILDHILVGVKGFKSTKIQMHVCWQICLLSGFPA